MKALQPLQSGRQTRLTCLLSFAIFSFGAPAFYLPLFTKPVGVRGIVLKVQYGVNVELRAGRFGVAAG